MKYQDNFFQNLLRHHGKPLIKEAIQEFLSENELTITSIHPARHSNLISTQEAIQLLGGVDRHTLYRFINEGLPAFKSGKSYKFRAEDINRFIDQRGVKPKLRKSA